MSKFDDLFGEPVYFSHGAYVISGSYTKEEAAEIISEEIGENVTAESLERDYVRFGFAPEHTEGYHGKACWYTGAGNSKGTKAVWVYP